MSAIVMAPNVVLLQGCKNSMPKVIDESHEAASL